MVRPRRDRMLSVSTSAGRSAVPCSSMPTVRRTASAVSVSPFSMSSSSSVKRRSAGALSAGAPVMRDLVAAHVDVAGERPLDEPQDLVAGAEQVDHDLRVGDRDLGLHVTAPGRRSAALEGYGVPVIGRPVRPAPPALFLGAARGSAHLRIVQLRLVHLHQGAIVSARPASATMPLSPHRHTPSGPGSAHTGRSPLADVHPVEGLLLAGEPVRRPVHPDHRARPRPGSAAAARRPPGRTPYAARPAGRDRLEDRRRPAGRRVGDPGPQRAVAPGEHVLEALAPPRPEHRAVRRAAPAGRASTARCRPGPARPPPQQLVRQVDGLPPRCRTSRAPRSPARRGAVAAAAPVDAGEEAGHRAVVADVHDPVRPAGPGSGRARTRPPRASRRWWSAASASRRGSPRPAPRRPGRRWPGRPGTPPTGPCRRRCSRAARPGRPRRSRAAARAGPRRSTRRPGSRRRPAAGGATVVAASPSGVQDPRRRAPAPRCRRAAGRRAGRAGRKPRLE